MKTTAPHHHRGTTRRLLRVLAAALVFGCVLSGAVSPAMASGYEDAQAVSVPSGPITTYIRPAQQVSDTSDPGRFVIYQVIAGYVIDTDNTMGMENTAWGSGVAWEQYTNALMADDRLTDAVAYIQTGFDSPDDIGDMSGLFAGILHEYPYLGEAMAAIAVTCLGPSYTTTQWDADRNAWSFTVDTPGFYLIADTYEEPESGTVDDCAVPGILEIRETQELSILAFPPGVTRTAEYGKAVVMDMGTPFTFDIVGSMPYDIDDYDAFHLEFHEHLDPGIIADTGSIEVAVDGVPIREDESTYTLDILDGPADGGTNMVFTFHDVKDPAFPPVTGTSIIEIKYTAVASQAAATEAGLDSYTQLHYSLTTDGSGDGLSVRQHAKIYTTALSIDTDAGSRYTIQNLNGMYCKLKSTSHNEWCVQGWLPSDDQARATVLEQPTDGPVVIYGLGANYYVIHEAAAPEDMLPFSDLPFCLTVDTDDDGNIVDAAGIVNDIERGKTCDYASISCAEGGPFQLIIEHDASPDGTAPDASQPGTERASASGGGLWMVGIFVAAAAVTGWVVLRKKRTKKY